MELLASGYGLIEGPRTDGLGGLYFSDVPNGGVYRRAPEGETGASYADRLLDHGIVVSPGAFFGPGNDGFFRVALVPDVAGCEEALARWAAL